MVDIVESGGVETNVDLKASFSQALGATQPLDVKGMDVAITPSQGMHGGKMEATKGNREYLEKLNA